MINNFRSLALKRINYYSRINSRHVFLHVPKTGGTYIGQYERGSKPVISETLPLGHRVLSDDYFGYGQLDKKEYNQLTRGLIRRKGPLYLNWQKRSVFTVVRNPFSWLLSYAGHAGCWNTKYLNTEHLDYQTAQRGFEYLIKTICDRDDVWPSRRFLFCQFFTLQGRWVPNTVLFNETLDVDLKFYARSNNLQFSKKPPQRVGKKIDYRTEYSDKLVDIVRDAFSRELELFGYQFESPVSDYNVKHSNEQYNTLTYNWTLDQLQ